MRKLHAPTGGFGNHVRWLVLLDQQYKFKLQSKIVSHSLYHAYKQPDWPDYTDFIDPNTTLFDLDPEIATKIQKILPIFCLDFSNQAVKLSSIEQAVYHQGRSWHNWLRVEWTYRPLLNNHVYFDHFISDLEDTVSKRLILTLEDPMLALQSYLKFNSNLNNSTHQDFLTSIKKYREQHITLPLYYPQIKVDSSDLLFQPTLDRDFYNRLIEWFELDDNYELANQVHKLWYDAHCRSEKEFVADITNFYNQFN